MSVVGVPAIGMHAEIAAGVSAVVFAIMVSFENVHVNFIDLEVVLDFVEILQG